MATAVVSGCGDYSKINPNETEKYDVKKEEQLNGKGNHHKNGYVKSILLTNGVTKSVVEDESAGGGGGGCPAAWEGSFEKCSLLTAALTHLGLYLLMLLGFLNQLLFTPPGAREKNREGYAPLYNPFEQFFSRYVYRRVRHVFNRPICSAPGDTLVLKERHTQDYNWTFRNGLVVLNLPKGYVKLSTGHDRLTCEMCYIHERFTGRERLCINLGSYNYLGFAERRGACAEAAGGAARRYGLALGSARAELGSTPLHRDLEDTIAAFLGVEAAIVFGMGFATNSLVLPALAGVGAGAGAGGGSLVLSDENNHASLILGLRLARVAVRVFRHNDLRHLETLARAARQENKWDKIIVVVEGVYSMEGSIVPLPGIIALKKKYGLHVYLDEAHSIGALGGRGRGVTDYWGVDPADVDVLMGTFTKSFGAAGGYIAGSRRVVRWVRAHGHAHSYAHGLAPPVAAQVLAATRCIAAPAGARRVARLRENTHYFRRRLQEMGVVVFGHADSPVVPLLVYTFSKMAATVERLTARGVATVGVGFPATPLNKARIRFCLSAAHTRAQLDECLAAIAAVVAELGLDYSRRPAPR